MFLKIYIFEVKIIFLKKTVQNAGIFNNYWPKKTTTVNRSNCVGLFSVNFLLTVNHSELYPLVSPPP